MFYTYLWLREDGTPYYVGKGQEDRAFIDHWVSGRVRRVPPKERIVVHPAESEAEALETEIALIWYYGRKDLGTGCLRNLTDGGENPPRRTKESYIAQGLKHRGIKRPPRSAEWSEKIAKTKRGKPSSEKQKKAASEWGKTRVFSEAHRQRISEANRGRHMSIEQRRLLSTIKTGKPWSEARRAAYNRRKENVSIQ